MTYRPIRVVVKHGEKYYRANLTQAQAIKHDNGALFSCGLTVPDDVPEHVLKQWIGKGYCHEISQETYNHSGCQSSCILRGDPKCQW